VSARNRATTHVKGTGHPAEGELTLYVADKIRKEIARIEGEMGQLKAMVKHNLGDPVVVSDCNDRLRQSHTGLIELQKNLRRALGKGFSFSKPNDI
jgi:hypothetical protein